MKKRFILSFGPAILVFLTIFILSALPGSKIKLPPVWNADKLIHMFVYAVQTSALIWGFWKYYKKDFQATKAIRFSVIFSIIMGGVIEVLQEHVFIDRAWDYLDFTANSLGALLVGLIVYIITRRHKSIEVK